MIVLRTEFNLRALRKPALRRRLSVLWRQEVDAYSAPPGAIFSGSRPGRRPKAREPSRCRCWRPLTDSGCFALPAGFGAGVHHRGIPKAGVRPLVPRPARRPRAQRDSKEEEVIRGSQDFDSDLSYRRGGIVLVPQGSPPPEAAIPVKLGSVRRIRTGETVAVSGSVVSWKDPSNVAFAVSGKVVEAVPREGDAVRQGQVLARIDPADFSLAVEAAEAQVAAAGAALDKADSPARPEVLEQARIAFDRAQDEYRRMKQLYDSQKPGAQRFS